MNSAPRMKPTTPPPWSAVTTSRAKPMPMNATLKTAVAIRCARITPIPPKARLGRADAHKDRSGALPTGTEGHAREARLSGLPRTKCEAFRPQSRRGSRSDDHHSARRVLEDVVGRVAEDRRARLASPRRAHDDDLRVALRGFADDRPTGSPVTREPADHVDAVGIAERARAVEQLVRHVLRLGHRGIE